MVTRSAGETPTSEDAGMMTVKRHRRPARPDQLLARADAIRRQLDQLAAMDTAGDWRQRLRRADTVSRLLTQEAKLRHAAAPDDTFDFPF